MRHLMRAVVAGLGVVMLAGCVIRPLPPYRRGVVYGQESVPQEAPVYQQAPVYSAPRAPVAQYGVIKSIQVIAVEQPTTGAGALIGGVLGAVVGRQFGNSSSGRATGTAVGAVGGVLVGNEIERQQTDVDERLRVAVRMDDGSTRVFSSVQIGGLRVGDRVRVEGHRLMREG